MRPSMYRFEAHWQEHCLKGEMDVTPGVRTVPMSWSHTSDTSHMTWQGERSSTSKVVIIFISHIQKGFKGTAVNAVLCCCAPPHDNATVNFGQSLCLSACHFPSTFHPALDPASGGRSRGLENVLLHKKVQQGGGRQRCGLLCAHS